LLLLLLSIQGGVRGRAAGDTDASAAVAPVAHRRLLARQSDSATWYDVYRCCVVCFCFCIASFDVVFFSLFCFATTECTDFVEICATLDQIEWQQKKAD
jgi:hypothetical protein